MFFPTKKLAHRMRIVFGLLGLNATELHGNLSMIQVWYYIVSDVLHRKRGPSAFLRQIPFDVVVGVVRCIEVFERHLSFSKKL